MRPGIRRLGTPWQNNDSSIRQVEPGEPLPDAPVDDDVDEIGRPLSDIAAAEDVGEVVAPSAARVAPREIAARPFDAKQALDILKEASKAEQQLLDASRELSEARQRYEELQKKVLDYRAKVAQLTAPMR